MTSVVIPDMELIGSLDFDPEVACEHDPEPCDAPATWLLLKGCCGSSFSLCDGHTESTKKFIATWGKANGLYCRECNMTGMNEEDFTWTRL